MRGWPSRMGRHWHLIIIFWLAHWNIDFECQTISHTNISSRRLMFYIYPQPLEIIAFETDWRALHILMHFRISSHISSGQNIVISVLLIRLTILSGKFLMWTWPSWMGSSWLLITTFRLGSCTIDLNIRHKHYLTKTNVRYTHSHWKLLLI